MPCIQLLHLPSEILVRIAEELLLANVLHGLDDLVDIQNRAATSENAFRVRRTISVLGSSNYPLLLSPKDSMFVHSSSQLLLSWRRETQLTHIHHVATALR